MTNHDQILIKLIHKCLTIKYEKYFESLLQNFKHSNKIDWVLIKEEFYNKKRNFSDDLIVDQELFEAMIDLIDDYFSKEVKIYTNGDCKIWDKFVEFCKQENIQFEVIGTYEENEISDAELEIISSEYEMTKLLQSEEN